MAQIIHTVCGDILPENLGFTTMHEHTIADMGPLIAAQQMYKDMVPPKDLEVKPENMPFLRSGVGLFSEGCSPHNDVEWLIKELEIFRDKVGGSALVDASPISMRGDVRLIQQASQATGVHIIVATGFYYEMGRLESERHLTEDDVYRICKDEVENGIDGTDIYPGFLKCGMSSHGPGSEIPQCEWDALRALSSLAVETGFSLHVHTAVPMTPEQIISVAKCALDIGVKPDRLYMMHLDQYLRTPYNIDDYIRNFDQPRSVNIELQCKLLDMGCTIGFDSWDSLVHILPDNYDRMKALVELLRRGYGGQIVLGHDVSDKSHSASFGYTGYTGFAANVIPKLFDFMDVIEAEDVDKLVYDNPAKLLAIQV